MIGATLRLALLLSLLAAIAVAQLVRSDAGTPVTLAAGALLLCALFAGSVSKGVGLPRLTGYLLIGIAIGPYVLKFIPAEGVQGLELVKGLAVSLIAFSAGAHLHLGLVRRVGKRVLVLCALISLAVFLTSGGALLALRPFLPFLRDLGWHQAVAVSALVATVIVSFSPTVTIAIVQETGAHGPFTEFLMGLVILGDLVVMVGFALAAGWTRASFGGELDLGGLAGSIGWELFGSLLIGGLAGLVTLLYLRKVEREVPLFIIALSFVSAEMGAQLHLSPLLLSLAAGAVIANLDAPSCERLKGAIERAGLPIFALFFAAAGAGLNLGALKVVGPVALALVAVRAGTLYLSTRSLARPGEDNIRKFGWMGLISQAGVTFGLAALVRRAFPTFGSEVEVLIVAMVTVHELIGPVLTRRALDQAGEMSSAGGPKTV
ncbi:MAG: cation:proton antiporter [Myxococcaceae bacterium]